MHAPPPVRIVGGGMTGLTLALRLARQDVPVVVHEAVPALGGLTSTDTLGDVPIERFYHCLLPTDTALLALFDEIGLGHVVGWTRTRTGFFTGERLLDMTTSLDFLRFPALGMLDRARLAWTILYCGLNRNWRQLDREPIGPFLRRHGGDSLFETIWEPLLLAKLGPRYDRFAASFIWATVARMLSARKAKGRSEKLGFVRGRYHRVFEALRQAIEAAGGQVSVGRAVHGVARHGPGRWELDVGDASLPASAIVLCVPAPTAAGWIRDVAPAGAAALDDVEYLGVVCEALLLRRSVTPYYVLNLVDRGLPFTGVIETSNLTGRDEYDGHALVYLPRYCEQSSPLWDTPDEEIHRENLAGLRKILPDLADGDVVDARVFRARAVQPVHPVGGGDRLPPVRLADGLAYVSTAQIYPWPVFNDEVVRHVDKSLDTVLACLQNPGLVASSSPPAGVR